MALRLIYLALGSCLLLAATVQTASGPPRGAPGSSELLPPAALVRIGSLTWHQGGPVTALAFSKGDLALFSAGTGTGLRVWDPKTGKELAPPGLPDVTVTAMSLTRDGRVLALAGTDRIVRGWDLERNRALGQWSSGTTPCALLTVSPCGKFVAWRHGDGEVCVRELGAARDAHVIKMPGENLTCMAFSPDSRHLLIGSFRLGGLLVDLRSGKRIRRYPPGERPGRDLVLGVLYTPDGKQIVTAVDEGKYHVYEADSLEEAKQLIMGTTRGAVMALAPDGKTLAAGNSSNNLGLWSLESGKPIRTLTDSTETVTALAFSHDGKTLAAGYSTGQVRLWDAETGKERFKAGTRSPFLAAGFQRDGAEIVTLDATRLSVWEARTGKARRQVLFKAERLREAHLSPAGRVAALVEVGGLIRLLDLDTGTERATIKTPFDLPGLLAFSPDGRWLATLSRREANIVRVWDAHTGKERQALKTETGYLRFFALAFSSDGRTILTGSPDPTHLQRWEVSSGRRRLPCQLPEQVLGLGDADARLRASRLALMGGGATTTVNVGETLTQVPSSPDGRLVALARGNRVYLCDPHTGKVVRQLEGAVAPVQHVVFSHDGKLLAGGDDRTVRLWDARTGLLRASLAGHRGPLTGLTFAPGSKKLLSTSADATALVWDVAATLKTPVVAATPRVVLRPIDVLWNELAADDATVAEKAQRQMVLMPAATEAWLRRHLRPVPRVEPPRLERLLADLDSAEATVRDRATAELEELHEQAEAALRTASRSASPEVRKRAARLLEKLERPVVSGTQARLLRAVEVLEHLATPGARRLLADLARGAPEAALTRDAAAVLRRLPPPPDAEP